MVSLTAAAHPFYVSIFTLNYDEPTQALQITVKVFSDDLEKGIDDMTADKFRLNNKHVDERIQKYVTKTLQISLDGKQQNLDYVGKEVELDVTYLYFEVVDLNAPEEILVTCSFLTEAYEDQTNIVHLSCGESKESLYLKRGSLTDSVANLCE